jgi:transcriptional regulator with XRE-family HTH domain
MEVGMKVNVFNLNLRLRRKELGYTQAELAERVNVYPQFISDIETLKPLSRSITNYERLESIAVELDCDFDWLFPPDYIAMMDVDRFPWTRMVFQRRIVLTEIANQQHLLLKRGLEEEALDEVMKEHVDKMLEYLGDFPREIKVLCLRYGLRGEEPHTLEGTAAIMGVTRERISQIQQQAFSRLRHPAIRREIRDYLEPKYT